ncbi:MAG: diguanylate cyclase, partial [Gammaproteobacteria bacterium]|nr:diguanylate cyclase [Gammaproteobacteria bacterium]
MGALFLAFGFILQWILQRVLTRPFLHMVYTAQRFADGSTEARFDERRVDEFGFLGKFFNKALDFLLVQQDELREALNRVRESETALYQEKERAEVTLYSIGDAVITTDESGRVDYFNPVAERLTGWVLENVQGKPLCEVMRLVNENTRETVANPVELCLKCGEILELAEHTLLIRDDGEEVAIADSAAPIRDRAGHIIGAVMVFHDVGHARKLARQLSYQATHDALTGLYNRRAFEEQLKESLESAREEEREHALCYLDLDQFKIVNDTCGHIAGDEMLKQLAHLLQSKVREADVLARLGGDEFGVLLRYCALDQARVIAEDLRRTVRDFRF